MLYLSFFYGNTVQLNKDWITICVQYFILYNLLPNGSCTVFLLRNLIGTIPSPNDQRRPLPLLLCDSSSTVQVYSMLWIYRVNKILFSMPVLKSFCPKNSLNIPDKIINFQGIFIFTVYQTTHKWRESNLGCWVQTRVCGSGSDHLAGFRTKMIGSRTVLTGFNDTKGLTTFKQTNVLSITLSEKCKQLNCLVGSGFKTRVQTLCKVVSVTALKINPKKALFFTLRVFTCILARFARAPSK